MVKQIRNNLAKANKAKTTRLPRNRLRNGNKRLQNQNQNAALTNAKPTPNLGDPYENRLRRVEQMEKNLIPLVEATVQHKRNTRMEKRIAQRQKNKEEQIKDGDLFFQSKRNKYRDCLLAPELYMARVPFIIGLPTSVCKVRSIWTFVPTGSDPILCFSFNPNGILCMNVAGAEFGYPFCWATTTNATGSKILDNHITNTQ